jgi:polyphosphate kinase
VLELAQDKSVPLLERVRYLAIFSSNLDEFFMKRVGGLHRQRASNVSELSPDGMNVQEQLDAIHATLLPMLEAHVATWLNDLCPALAEHGIRIRSYESLDEAERQHVDQFFVKQVFPILTPLAVDPGHPFPFISNLSKSIGVTLEHPGRAEPLFVRIKMPENLPRWVPLPGNTAGRHNFIPLEQVIGGNLPILFPG